MARGALAFPVLPGKTEADIRSIADEFTANPRGYWESRNALGCTLERAYWQHTPMGDFVVAYVESSAASVAEAFTRAADDQTEMGRFFRDKILEVHGIDITQAPPGPAPEVVAEWIDPDVTSRGRGFAFCAPLIPEMESSARAWAADAYSRPGLAETRRGRGQSREIATLMHGPLGPIVTVYFEGTDPDAANRDFASSTAEFDTWFKESLATFFPPFVDFSAPIPGIVEIFDSETVGGGADITGHAAAVTQPA